MHWLVAWSVRAAEIVKRRPLGVLLSTGRLGGGGQNGGRNYWMLVVF